MKPSVAGGRFTAAAGSEPPVFPESEQGVGTKRHRSPASMGITVALEWNPGFTRTAEPGYEQCSPPRTRTNVEMLLGLAGS